ncbi:MAG: helix-turn-helix domain-containing protein [Lewinellaceae bacterium]|nr:helix-turn-helix domain-containing protein [Lewinellaceae bacterium]
MKYEEFLPSHNLRPYLERFFTISLTQEQPIRELIIPDGTHGILFVQQESFRRQSAFDEKDAHHLNKSYVFGQKSNAVYYSLEKSGLYCFGVKLRPNGLSAFTPVPANEMTDTFVEAPLLFGYQFKMLEEQVFGSPSIEQKIQRLESYFLEQLPANLDEHQRLARQILAFIHQQKGQVSIARLLEIFNIGYKRMERLFKKHVGLSPKAYCRIARFNATLFYQKKHPEENLTQLAYSAGYFDQMHFVKEVKHFTNLTPSAFYQQSLQAIGTHQRQSVAERFA